MHINILVFNWYYPPIILFSDAYCIDETCEPWTVAVIPWRSRTGDISEEDIAAGQTYSAKYKPGDEKTMQGTERVKAQNAKRKRKQRQTQENQIQKLSE